jgi:hypothetical protein
MKKTLLPALLAATLAAPALAEEPVIVMHEHFAFADAPQAAVDGDAWRRWAEEFSREMRHNMGAMFGPRMHGKVVKGAPYAAEVITETNQALADGNVISHRKTGAVYRDGEGRTRQESGPEGKERSVFIHDPVAGRHYVLSPGSKRVVSTAVAPRAMAFTYDGKEKNKQVVRIDGAEVRVEDGKVFVDGKEASPGRVEIVKGGKTIVVENGKVTIDGKEIGGEGHRHTVIRRVDAGDGTQRDEVRVQVIRSGDGKEIAIVPPIAPAPPVPPAPAVPPVPPVAMAPLPGVNVMRFESTARLGKGVTTSLGTKEFDGVKAEGKSTTWTIPAGQVGNRNPINIMSESWYSPELQVTVYSRHSDPRTGESIYRLASIRRGEPSADLFKVPEDYQVKKRRAPKG